MSDTPPPPRAVPLDAEFVAAYAQRLHRIRKLEAFILSKADGLESAGKLPEAAEYRATAGADTSETDWSGIVR